MRIGIEARRLFSHRKTASDQLTVDLIHGLMDIDRSNEYYIFTAPGSYVNCMRKAPNFHLVILEAFSPLHWEQVILPRAVERYALDLVHCTTATGMAKTQAKTLLQINDGQLLNPVIPSKSIVRRLWHSYRRRLFRKMAHRSWGLVASCHDDQRLLERLSRPLVAKARVIHPGINNRYLYDPSYKRPAQVPQEYLLHMGSVQPKSNMRNVLKGYELYTKMSTRRVLPLVLTGIGQAQLETMLKEMGLGRLREHIYLIGKIRKHELPGLYYNASLVLCPYLRDDAGSQVLEAMACGTIVLTSDNASLKELVGAAAYLVNPFSPEEISHGMFKVLHDPEARNRMLVKSGERVRHYMWTQVARRYQNIYMEIVADSIDLPFTSEDLIPS